MGYCYTNDGKLCCDKCSGSGDVRKRTCPHKVDGLPYCPAPALCDECLKELGGNAKLHTRCKEHAKRSQDESDSRKARIAAGDHMLATAWGSWHELVPAGYVGMRFVGTSDEVHILVEDGKHDELRKSGCYFLSEFKDFAEPWLQHA
jgi:hypothetical protein